MQKINRIQSRLFYFYLILAQIVLFSFVLFSGSVAFAGSEKVSLIRIDRPTPELIRSLQGEHYDIVFASPHKRLDMVVSRGDLLSLDRRGVHYTVIHDDFPLFLSERARRDKTPLPGSMGGFHTFDEVITFLDDLHAAHPAILSAKYSVGTSIEGRTIWCYKLSDNVSFDEAEPEVFYNSLIHAREPQGMECLLYYLDHLTNGYGTDAEATYLVNNREMFFIPVVNPDGYEYNRQYYPNGGGMWRKNRRLNAGGSHGVDLNRNFGYEWGYDNYGSSPDPSSETYRGTDPFSEPETQFIRDFCNAHNFLTALNYHTYSNLLIRPFSYDDVPLNPPSDINLYDAWGALLTRTNGYLYGDAASTVGYNVNGGADDWMYGERVEKPKTISFTPEIGSYEDSFWPAPSRIEPLALENIEMNLLIAWLAHEYCEISTTDWTLGDQNGNGYPDGNEDAFLAISGRSLGLETATGFSVELSCDNPDVTITDPVIYFGDVATLALFSNETTPYHVSFGPTLQTGDKIAFTLTGTSAGFQRELETLSLIIGEPLILFFDDMEAGFGNWTSSTAWDTTDSTSHSPTHSLADSPIGNYHNNAVAPCTMIDSVSLDGLIEPRLTFWTHWDIEPGYDFAQALISTDDGANWTPLEGIHTKPGSGNGVQDTGEPGYDGIQSSWIKETIDLSAYSGEQNVRIRFIVKSDVYLTGDGWFVDDVTILGYLPNTDVPAMSTISLLISLALLGAALGHTRKKN